MSNRRQLDVLHTAACSDGRHWYVDPVSGYRVFTAVALAERPSCCGSSCRHCPFGHSAVPHERRHNLIRDPWIENLEASDEPVEALFWSGGKDSFLAWMRLHRSGSKNIVLVTTFDGATESLAHQDLHLSAVRRQARSLNLPLLCIPLYRDGDYIERVTIGLRTLARRRPVQCVAFGDLNLRSVRRWREAHLEPALTELGARLTFPLWRAPYDDLMNELTGSGVQCFVSAVDSDACRNYLAIGDVFDRDVAERLPAGVDLFGENGEFHTFVDVPPGFALPLAAEG